MVQGPFPIQDDESAELTERGSPERPYRRLRWLVMIILAVLLFFVAWSFGPGESGSDDAEAEAGTGQLVAITRSSLR